MTDWERWRDQKEFNARLRITVAFLVATTGCLSLSVIVLLVIVVRG